MKLDTRKYYFVYHNILISNFNQIQGKNFGDAI